MAGVCSLAAFNQNSQLFILLAAAVLTHTSVQGSREAREEYLSERKPPSEV